MAFDDMAVDDIAFYDIAVDDKTLRHPTTSIQHAATVKHSTIAGIKPGTRALTLYCILMHSSILIITLIYEHRRNDIFPHHDNYSFNLIIMLRKQYRYFCFIYLSILIDVCTL